MTDSELQSQALAMLSAGWKVQRSVVFGDLGWRSPRGISGSEYHSDSLDRPPAEAIRDATIHYESAVLPHASPS